MNGKKTVIPFQLKELTLQQLCNNNMGIGKMRLLVHESVCKVIMNADIKFEKPVRQCAKCLDYQQTQPYKKTKRYDIP